MCIGVGLMGGECSPGLRRGLILSFLCSRTISVVFRVFTGI